MKPTQSSPARALRNAALLWPFPVLAGLAAAGCSRPAGVLFEPADPRYRWPAAPDDARVQYIGQLQSDQDLKPARSGGKGLNEFLFGKDAAHTMLSPIGVCSDGHGRLFVADSNAQAVHVFDLGTRKYELWRPPEGQPRFSQPVAIAFDGRVLVADSVAGLIFAFDPRGKLLGTFGLNKLKRPCGIAADPSHNRLFVVDSAAHQVVILSSSGEEIGRLGQRGSGPGQFNFPTSATLDGQGRLYVSDSLNFRIQVFSPELAFVRQIGRKGDMPGYFSQPKGIALDPDGHLYVVDANFEAVQLFGDQGELLMTFGHEGHGPGEFWLPVGIHIDSSGRVFIADAYNRRVQVFQYLAEGRSP